MPAGLCASAEEHITNAERRSTVGITSKYPYPFLVAAGGEVSIYYLG